MCDQKIGTTRPHYVTPSNKRPPPHTNTQQHNTLLSRARVLHSHLCSFTSPHTPFLLHTHTHALTDTHLHPTHTNLTTHQQDIFIFFSMRATCSHVFAHTIIDTTLQPTAYNLQPTTSATHPPSMRTPISVHK